MWRVHTLNETVDREFEQLPPEIQARFLWIADLIQQYGLPNVGMPYVRHVQGDIWEIRISGKNKIGRGLYVALKDRQVVVLRFFIKKTQKTPQKEIRTAQQRMGFIDYDQLG